MWINLSFLFLFLLNGLREAFAQTSTTSPVVVNVAGNGYPWYHGDGGDAMAAALYYPEDVVLDSSGNVFISDTFNNLIRVIYSSGSIIVTYAGTSSSSEPRRYDFCYAPYSILKFPRRIAFDSAGNLFVADSGNFVVRRISKVTQVITIYAGTLGRWWGSAGDGGSATSGVLVQPYGLAFDASDNLYISDAIANYIRRVDKVTNIISTFAGRHDYQHFCWTRIFGLGTAPAVQVNLNRPTGLSFDANGFLYAADSYNNVIRKFDMSRNVVSIFAGILYRWGNYGDGSQATSAVLTIPTDIAFDSSGNAYISDSGNHVIRVVSTSGIISRFAGVYGSICYNGNGLQATATNFFNPSGISIYNGLSVYIADTYHNLIRLIVIRPNTNVVPTPAPTAIVTRAPTVTSTIAPTVMLTNSPTDTPPSFTLVQNGNDIVLSFTVSLRGGGSQCFDLNAAVSAAYSSRFSVKFQMNSLTNWVSDLQVIFSPANQYFGGNANRRNRWNNNYDTDSDSDSDSDSDNEDPNNLGSYPNSFKAPPRDTSTCNSYSWNANSLRQGFTKICLKNTCVLGRSACNNLVRYSGQIKLTNFRTSTAVSTSSNPPVCSFATSLPPPTPSPTLNPSFRPTVRPSISPSTQPSLQASSAPSIVPSIAPTRNPTPTPIVSPSSNPTSTPTTANPTLRPSSSPTLSPSSLPSTNPSSSPTPSPSSLPSAKPSHVPSMFPSSLPSSIPTALPSAFPTIPPTTRPTAKPKPIPNAPTIFPTSVAFTLFPTAGMPTASPTNLTVVTDSPTPDNIELFPTLIPTGLPPTIFPTDSSPTFLPTYPPIPNPTSDPTVDPTSEPTLPPINAPTVDPTSEKTTEPTAAQTAEATTP
jgi:sugar lactone lactonase YvrE